MPIGVVSDVDFEKELSRTSGSTKPGGHVSPIQIIEKEKRGRSAGDVNVPDSLRKIIGETSVIEGRQSALALAESFGISPSSVSAYANGATSTKSYDTPSQSILSHINKSRARATKKASHVLNSALKAISQEKLDYTDARDLSGIAKDMSVIIKNLEPPPTQAESSNQSSPQFTIYAPQFRQENSFEIIKVNE
jgi:predicted transcriptional regulator